MTNKETVAASTLADQIEALLPRDEDGCYRGKECALALGEAMGRVLETYDEDGWILLQTYMIEAAERSLAHERAERAREGVDDE